MPRGLRHSAIGLRYHVGNQSSGCKAIKTYLFLMTAADAHRSRCREFADPHVYLDFMSLICAGGSRLSSSNFQLHLPHPQNWYPIDITLSPRHRWMLEMFGLDPGQDQPDNPEILAITEDRVFLEVQVAVPECWSHNILIESA